MDLRSTIALGVIWGLSACTTSDNSEDSATSNGGSASAADGSGSGGATAVDGSGGDDSAALGCAVPEMPDTTDGMSDALQETWGAPCTTDAECVTLIGAGAVCLMDAVIYELPAGYCSKMCALPDADTRVVPDDPTCDPAGGVACLGVMGTFEVCAKICTDDAQCNRDGYTCRQMPAISQATDPSFCLMPDCCEGSCSDPGD